MHDTTKYKKVNIKEKTTTTIATTATHNVTKNKHRN